MRRNYFLAACSLLNESTNFDFVIAMKLRPYGRLIGIDSSLMDRFLKDSKILRPHAILHDAVGYIQESTKKDRVTLTFYHVTLTALCKKLFF